MSVGEKVSLLLKNKTKIKAKLINVEDSTLYELLETLQLTDKFKIRQI